MRVIGITGPSGSGKTLLSSRLAARGHACIDADELYHSMLIPPSACLDAIRERFGNGVFLEDGSLDRRALGSIVFGDAKKLELLNKTVLSIVIARVHEIIAELEVNGRDTVIVDAPTLIESGFAEECDTVISVIAPKDIRIERISARDGIDRKNAKARVSAQKDDGFYRSASDFVIYNSGDVDSFAAHVDELTELLGL